MTKTSKILLVLAAPAVLAALFVPLWTISLSAPQYPEGIGMHIWAHQITGHDRYDLRRINQLNHYIGMKEIVPESIPELKFMPYILGFLAAFALLAGVVGSRRWVVAWLGLLMVLAVAGLADFYVWGRDYGTNLDPRAPIKVPGLTYQPPLIGSKQLLNITATSYPAAGGFLLMLAGLLGAGALVLDLRARNRPVPAGPREVAADGFGLRPVRSAGLRRRSALAGGVLIPLLILSLASCTPQPQPIRLGEDSCAYCLMTISNPRYGAELLTGKARVYKFDSVECLAAFRLKEEVPSSEIHSLWVVNFAQPKAFVPVEEALFLHSRLLKSPMGLYLTAFGDGLNAEKVQAVYTGEFIDWQEVLELVRAKWLETRVTGGTQP